LHFPVQFVITSATIQYVQDYDSVFPFARNDWVGPPNPINDMPFGPFRKLHEAWEHRLFPYAKSVQIFRCPSSSDGQQRNNAGASNQDQTGQTQFAAKSTTNLVGLS